MDGEIRSAEVVLPCRELAPTLAFFTERLGFRVDAIFPADAPSVAVVSGHGLRVRLAPGDGPPGVLRLACSGAEEAVLTAPNGTRVEVTPADPSVELPPLRPSFVVSRATDAWGTGRAGMRYRDLVPDRQGGRLIASHIRIESAGPVPDYVHYHRVRYQMIFCRAGEIRVVYEDQGEPFRLEAGDCVLQPPGIRHRVLESTAGAEVVELSSPAEHETLVDHELALPTGVLRPERVFGGQRFVRHVAAKAEWRPWRHAGFVARDLGIGEATNGLVRAEVVRADGARSTESETHDGELLFGFVLSGALELECRGAHSLRTDDAFVVPPREAFALSECSSDAELLFVRG